MSLTNPEISVIIPIHNRSNDLLRSVPSVLIQTERSFELLIIDDASTEDLGSVVRSFNDPRIQLIRNDQKGNAGSVRNTGIEHAKGKYIAFLDSDDEWMPEHLETRIAQIEKENVDGVFGSVFVFDGEKDTFVLSRSIREKQHAADYILSGGSIPTPTWVMRSEAAKTIKFDTSLVVHEDYDYFIRFSEKYKWSAMWQPTTRVYWQKGVTRLRNPKSEIVFSQRYLRFFSAGSYFNYCFSQLGYYRNNQVNTSIINYYKKECLRHIHEISFTDYCSVRDSRGSIGQLISWLSFSLLLLLRKFSKPAAPIAVEKLTVNN